jgi:hypothetical protein
MAERHRQLQDDLNAARRAQELLSPPKQGRHGSVSYRFESIPGRVVAGDLFDVFPLDESRTAFFLGDVSGKGVGAAMLMAACQSQLRTKLLSRVRKRLSASVAYVARWPCSANTVPPSPLHQPSQTLKHIVVVEPTSHIDAQALACELVHDNQHPERPAVFRPCLHEVVRPDMIATLRPPAYARAVIQPEAAASGLLLRHSKALLTPDPLDTLVVHSPALSPEQRRDPPVAVSPVRRGQFDDPPRQRLLVVPLRRPVPVRRTGLTHQPASPTLAHAEPREQRIDRVPTASRAQKFPEATSRNIALSSSASASSRFSRAFSFSSSLSFFA